MTATPSEAAPPRFLGAVEPDPRQPGSVRLLVQGRPLLSVPKEVAAREGLQSGTRLDPALFARLCSAADNEAAYRTALRVLERRPFAARDLERRLVLKGHAPSAAAEAVARAAAAGLVDDARYALAFIETRSARGRGPLRLRRDLAAAGVERAVIDRALAQAFGPEGQPAPDIEALARKRLAQLKGIPRRAARRRLLAYLARRGFQGAPVHRALSALLGPG